jgi:unsaturated chondroitin disaccharide hydrolase
MKNFIFTMQNFFKAKLIASFTILVFVISFLNANEKPLTLTNSNENKNAGNLMISVNGTVNQHPGQSDTLLLDENMVEVIQNSFNVAKKQILKMADYLDDKPDRMPRSYYQNEIITSNTQWWCSGFFPGGLWYLYEYFNDVTIQGLAESYQSRVEKEKYNTYDHDIGFQIYCSFGNGYRLTGNEQFREVLITAANSAIKRYNPNIGLIRSWDFNSHKWQYPVIIDNMMNLELLMWAFKETGDSIFLEVAVNHSDNTMLHHFRLDNSSYHVVSFNTITGQPHAKHTHQGAFHESIWARGQAWGLYGFTMMYRETGYIRYLEKAQKIADLMIGHPNMPDDMIPYWDYLAPGIPDELRDASSAAIMASALVELSSFSQLPESKKYLRASERQIKILASPDYLAQPGSNGYFLLKGGVGNMPGGYELNVPLTYADYYFIEALTRYNNLKKNK